jgi:hypothetical protein
MAERKAVFVIRADGSVISAKNNTGWWSGDPLSAPLRPGDTIVVPEKAPKVGGPNLRRCCRRRSWRPLLRWPSLISIHEGEL